MSNRASQRKPHVYCTYLHIIYTIQRGDPSPNVSHTIEAAAEAEAQMATPRAVGVRVQRRRAGWDDESRGVRHDDL